MTDAWTAFVQARLATEEDFLRIAKLGAKTAQRMRNEIDAKRAILALHQPMLDEYTDADGQSRSSFACGECDAGGVPDNWPCPTVRALASFWAHDPGYPGEHQTPHSVV